MSLLQAVAAVGRCFFNGKRGKSTIISPQMSKYMCFSDLDECMNSGSARLCSLVCNLYGNNSVMLGVNETFFINILGTHY